MKKVALIFFLLTTVAACAQASLSQDELHLLSLLNQEREKAGLDKLQWDAHLADAAYAHTKKMVDHQELSHQFDGERPLDERIGATNLRFNAAAENVAVAPTVEQAHQGLMNSPPHRANILSPKYNFVGFGIVSGSGGLYVTQDFAHVLPIYSEAEFRDAIIATVNKERRARKIPVFEARLDLRLQKAACTANVNPHQLLGSLPGVTDLVVFTSSVPEKLPASMQNAIADPSLQRMNIGVCFKPGTAHGFGSFYVVASFSPAP
jgi:hypothetical protein